MKTLDQFLSAVKRERAADGTVDMLRWRIEAAIVEMGKVNVAKRRRLAVRIAAWAEKIWQSQETR